MNLFSQKGILLVGYFNPGMLRVEGVSSTQFVFLTIRLVHGNVVMVAIDMCGKSLTSGEWIYGIS